MIYIDSNEPYSMVNTFRVIEAEEKKKRSKNKRYANKYKPFKFKVQQIKINGKRMGDYAGDGWILERKTGEDLMHSLKQKRAYNQLEDISQFNGIRVWMLEGNLDTLLISYPEYAEWIISFSVLCARYGVHFWEASNKELFVRRIKWLDRYATKIIKSILRKQINIKLSNNQLAILSEFPNVGVDRAKLLLDCMGSLNIVFYEAINDPQKLICIKGIGKKSVESIHKTLLKPY